MVLNELKACQPTETKVQKNNNNNIYNIYSFFKEQLVEPSWK